MEDGVWTGKPAVTDMKGPGVEWARVGFKEADGTAGHHVHSTWTTSASPSIFAPLSIHSLWLWVARCLCLSSTSTLPFPFIFPFLPSFCSLTPSAPVIWVVYPTASLVYGQEAQEGEQRVQRERKEGMCEEVERHCSRSLTSGSAPLQLLDVFNSPLCICCHATVGDCWNNSHRSQHSPLDLVSCREVRSTKLKCMHWS